MRPWGITWKIAPQVPACHPPEPLSRQGGDRIGPFPCLNKGIDTQGVWLESLGVWDGEDRLGGLSLLPTGIGLILNESPLESKRQGRGRTSHGGSVCIGGHRKGRGNGTSLCVLGRTDGIVHALRSPMPPSTQECLIRQGPLRPWVRNGKTTVWRGPVCPLTQECQGNQVASGDPGT